MKVTDSKTFERIILFTIFVSSVFLAFESPLVAPGYWLKTADYVITAIFLFEVVVKVVTFGFICKGPKSYLLDTWNAIDLIIVIVSLIDFLPL